MGGMIAEQTGSFGMNQVMLSKKNVAKVKAMDAANTASKDTKSPFGKSTRRATSQGGVGRIATKTLLGE